MVLVFDGCDSRGGGADSACEIHTMGGYSAWCSTLVGEIHVPWVGIVLGAWCSILLGEIHTLHWGLLPDAVFWLVRYIPQSDTGWWDTYLGLILSSNTKRGSTCRHHPDTQSDSHHYETDWGVFLWIHKWFSKNRKTFITSETKHSLSRYTSWPLNKWVILLNTERQWSMPLFAKKWNYFVCLLSA